MVAYSPFGEIASGMGAPPEGSSKRLCLFRDAHKLDKFFPLETQVRGAIDDQDPVVILQRGLDRG